MMFGLSILKAFCRASAFRRRGRLFQHLFRHAWPKGSLESFSLLHRWFGMSADDVREPGFPDPQVARRYDLRAETPNQFYLQLKFHRLDSISTIFCCCST
jgi:hypothetical protein